ncbi:hypothetical protein [Parabacteroides sp. AM08-6]|uniref:hypothetical protein n=1 Tax=Parabacteroides sp. AM08-6 TaxID=2292053 RepID=UPI000F0103A3|nr:hypothetical protein [Parabacteroides sp. AM08-6]RHJ76136.1 hypothetical protein DW103_17275 [Parabacteroides sp. AM08-6]
MITINKVVTNKKGQKGTITRIITKSTGYVEVTFENGTIGKEMAFNLTDENGVALKKAPKSEIAGMSRGEKKRYKDAKAIQAFNALSPLQQAINKLQWINNCVYGDRSSMSYKLSEEMFAAIELKAKEIGNDFIISVCHSVDKYMSCSDKQAYCLAKFAVDNEIEL